MSYVIATPDALSAAASDLDGLGLSIEAASTAATAPTTNLLAAAQDEVSTAIAALFGNHAEEFHALSAQAAAFHSRFAQALSANSGTYGATEAANVAPLKVFEQVLLGLVNAPTELLMGRPLIGNGANG